MSYMGEVNGRKNEKLSKDQEFLIKIIRNFANCRNEMVGKRSRRIFGRSPDILGPRLVLRIFVLDYSSAITCQNQMKV